MKFTALIIIGLFFVLLGCNNSGDSGVEPDPELSMSYVDSAKMALENLLFQIINDNSVKQQDVDFTESQHLFNLAYQYDSKNPDANFGLALTNLLILNQEEETNNLFNEWEEFLNGNNNGFSKKTASLKTKFPGSVKAFAIPNKALVRSLINLPKAALNDPPQFNDVQEYIENKIIPKLDFALKALDVVDDNPDYKFMVSPRMQGDVNADSVEIDLTEIYALEVMLNILNTYANLTIAYNVDIWGYDSLQAINAFSKGGAFLKLRSGSKPMNNVKSSFFNGLNKMLAGLEFLLNETDPQENDLIKSDDFTQEDLNNIKQQVNDIINTVSTPQVYVDDWDNNPATPEEALTVNYGKIFDNPISDLKSVLPDYNVSVSGEEIGNQVWDNGNIDVHDQITVSSSDYYYYSRSYYWTPYGGESTYDNSNIQIPDFDTVFDSLVTAFKETSQVEYIYISLYWGDNLSMGANNVYGTIEYEIEKNVVYAKLFIPYFSWTASTFDQWIFPNPTFNGLLPNMTDSRLKQIFGITEDNWFN